MLLRIFGGLFCLLAISNLLKPLQLGDGVGFVLFGQRLEGTPNMIAGPLFGIFLLVYAWGIFTRRRFAVAMGIAYALYVIANLVAWNLFAPQAGGGGLAFSLAYVIVAVGVSGGAAYLLWQQRADLT